MSTRPFIGAKPDSRLIELATAKIVSHDEWLASCEPGWSSDRPSVGKTRDTFAIGRAGRRAATRWEPMAVTVGHLATRAMEAGRQDDVWQMVPHYLRRSAAEDKWDQRQRPLDLLVYRMNQNAEHRHESNCR